MRLESILATMREAKEKGVWLVPIMDDKHPAHKTGAKFAQWVVKPPEDWEAEVKAKCLTAKVAGFGVWCGQQRNGVTLAAVDVDWPHKVQAVRAVVFENGGEVSVAARNAKDKISEGLPPIESPVSVRVFVQAREKQARMLTQDKGDVRGVDYLAACNNGSGHLAVIPPFTNKGNAVQWKGTDICDVDWAKLPNMNDEMLWRELRMLMGSDLSELGGKNAAIVDAAERETADVRDPYYRLHYARFNWSITGQGGGTGFNSYIGYPKGDKTESTWALNAICHDALIIAKGDLDQAEKWVKRRIDEAIARGESQGAKPGAGKEVLDIIEAGEEVNGEKMNKVRATLLQSKDQVDRLISLENSVSGEGKAEAELPPEVIYQKLLAKKLGGEGKLRSGSQVDATGNGVLYRYDERGFYEPLDSKNLVAWVLQQDQTDNTARAAVAGLVNRVYDEKWGGGVANLAVFKGGEDDYKTVDLMTGKTVKPSPDNQCLGFLDFAWEGIGEWEKAMTLDDPRWEKCPNFKHHMCRALRAEEFSERQGANPDEDTEKAIEVLMRFLGYTLIPDRRIHKFMCLYDGNTGGTGKTTTFDLAKMLHGGRVGAQGLANTPPGVATFSLSGLADRMTALYVQSARLALDEDFSGGVGAEAEASLKKLSGGGGDATRAHYKGFSQTSTSVKVMFGSNLIPKWRVGGGPIRRRMIVLPMMNKVTQEIEGFSERLQNELPHIMRLVIGALRRLMRDFNARRDAAIGQDMSDVMLFNEPSYCGFLRGDLSSDNLTAEFLSQMCEVHEAKDDKGKPITGDRAFRVPKNVKSKQDFWTPTSVVAEVYQIWLRRQGRTSGHRDNFKEFRNGLNGIWPSGFEAEGVKFGTKMQLATCYTRQPDAEPKNIRAMPIQLNPTAYAWLRAERREEDDEAMERKQDESDPKSPRHPDNSPF